MKSDDRFVSLTEEDRDKFDKFYSEIENSPSVNHDYLKFKKKLKELAEKEKKE